MEVLKKKVLPLRQAKLERAINGCLVHFCWGKESTREESTRVHGRRATREALHRGQQDALDRCAASAVPAIWVFPQELVTLYRDVVASSCRKYKHIKQCYSLKHQHMSYLQWTKKSLLL